MLAMDSEPVFQPENWGFTPQFSSSYDNYNIQSAGRATFKFLHERTLRETPLWPVWLSACGGIGGE